MAAFLAAAGASGCGLHGSSSQATAAKVPAHSPAVTAATGALLVPAAKPVHVRADMSRPIGSSMECDDAPNIPPLSTQVQEAHAAVIARVLSIGAPVWNTPDGKRPTQAQADAMFDPPGVSVFTPFELKVLRVLSKSPVVGLTEGVTVNGFVRGGTTPFGDSFHGCFSVPSVPLGSTAVIFFGPEITTGVQSPTGLHQPEVWEFDPIVDGKVKTMLAGWQPIPWNP